ncbi:hypothetical protein P7D58_17065 [Enterococcus avium]|jgi:hypothetical protein|uniref:hypothetical protein n=1 Tax=Enterococcus TaxID=1350 RepID=UPI0008A48BEF|nr:MULTISPECIES: hypothetical protein [Enterococcus]MDT2419753.1 hypothetical protein [Enterococcus avium]MDT2432690.1 hypothetical protein [Enterococcus avium]OFL81982.1 hypothetical protein HMPREF2742_09300 [Enterococcus sp. HMSC072H05]
MKYMLDNIYEALCTNEYIHNLTFNEETEEYRIKYYQQPETADKSGAFITIRPVDVPNEAYHGSDRELSIEHLIQIDVESKYRATCKQIQYEIKKEMKTLGFGQVSGQGLDEYFSETNRYVDARRYDGNTRIYDTQY